MVIEKFHNMLTSTEEVATEGSILIGFDKFRQKEASDWQIKKI